MDLHESAYSYVARTTAHLPAGPVLEIGSRDINGSIRSLFPNRAYVGIDVAPGPGVDVVADGKDFVPPMTPGVAVCCEVFEHTPYAEAICRQMSEVLAPGGVFILTAAGVGRAPHSAVDGGHLRAGEFYANVTTHELDRWLSVFDEWTIETNPQAGDIYAIARKAAA